MKWPPQKIGLRRSRIKGWLRSGVESPARFVNQSYFRTISNYWTESWTGRDNWYWSQIETRQLLVYRTQLINLKVTNISELKPLVFISKQKRLGFKLNGNQLEEGQEFKKISSKFIGPGVPILILKEVEIMSGIWKRKVNFCLVNESFWLVFK